MPGPRSRMKGYTDMDTLAIDVAKESFEAWLLDETGVPVHDKPRSFGQTARAIRELLRWMRDPKKTRVILEPTGVYGKMLIKTLGEATAGVYQVNARILKGLGLSMVQTKTDSADVRGIGEAAFLLASRRPERLEEFRVAYEQSREDARAWMSEYDRLRRDIARLRCQIADMRFNPTPASRSIVERRESELRWLLRRQIEVRDEIKAALKQWAPEEVELLCSIPGIGMLSAAAIVTKVTDVARFDRVDAFKGYLGIYPRRSQTGKTERPAHMAKHGCPLIRHMLWNAAKAAARHNPACRGLFDRLVERGKSKPYAWAAVMRKLAQIIYGVLKSRRPFSLHHTFRGEPGARGLATEAPVCTP